jgi:hypothetical protein
MKNTCGVHGCTRPAAVLIGWDRPFVVATTARKLHDRWTVRHGWPADNAHQLEQTVARP